MYIQLAMDCYDIGIITLLKNITVATTFIYSPCLIIKDTRYKERKYHQAQNVLIEHKMIPTSHDVYFPVANVQTISNNEA